MKPKVSRHQTFLGSNETIKVNKLWLHLKCIKVRLKTINYCFVQFKLNTDDERILLLSNQPDLVLNLSRSESGFYLCRAQNGIGLGIQKQIHVQLYRKFNVYT